MDLNGITDKWIGKVYEAINKQKQTEDDFIDVRISKTDLRELRIILNMDQELLRNRNYIIKEAEDVIRNVYIANAYCRENEADICAANAMGVACDDCLYQTMMRTLRKMRGEDDEESEMSES